MKEAPSVIPLSQINDLDMRSNWMEQIFNFGSVYLDTASMNKGSRKTLRINNLTLDECNKVMHLIGQAIAKSK